MKQELSDKLRNVLRDAKDIVYGGATLFFFAYMMYSIFSHNGFWDSERTNEAKRHHNLNNPVKTVASVKEKWKDDLIYSLELTGFNPRVIRKVTFNDGSQTTLDYRVLAWQPFMRWVNGEEFKPKPGEIYEVTPYNQIVRKVK